MGLQLEVREGEQTIASLRQEVTTTHTRLRSVRTSLQQQIETLEVCGGIYLCVDVPCLCTCVLRILGEEK